MKQLIVMVATVSVYVPRNRLKNSFRKYHSDLPPDTARRIDKNIQTSGISAYSFSFLKQ